MTLLGAVPALTGRHAARAVRKAAAAVAPVGAADRGVLRTPVLGAGPHLEARLPTAAEVVASLELPDGVWEVLLSDEHERIQTRRLGDSRARVRTTS